MKYLSFSFLTPRLRLLSIVLALVCFFPPQTEATVRITEVMASNGGGYQDEEGDSPDWIELQNISSTNLNLNGWKLTDDPANLSKWVFPSTNLPASGFLVVFASEKRRTTPGRPLHTNFRLETEGSYLALVRPNGVVEQVFEKLPAQRENVSFGQGAQVRNLTLVSEGAMARFFVPSNNTLGINWVGTGFDDSAWPGVPTGVGFGGTTSVFSTILRVDFNARVGETGAANTEPGFSTMTLASNPSIFDGVTVTVAGLGGVGLQDRDRALPTPTATLTQDQLYDDFIFAFGQTNGNGLSLQLDGLPPGNFFSFKVWSYDNSSGGVRRSDWTETASGSSRVITNGYQFDGTILPQNDGDNTIQAQVQSSTSGQIRIEGRRNGGTSYGVYLNAFELSAGATAPQFRSDVSSAMSNQAASAYLRIPFVLTNLAGIASLRLKMKYDDGFVAYLNGLKVAERNAPTAPPWNSTATNNQAVGQEGVFEEIPIVNFGRTLQNGSNVLAVHGLNASVNDSDFLLVPILEATMVSSGEPLFYSPGTPGTVNGDGFIGLVADTKFSVDRGFYDLPFTVAITTATARAEIYWTTNGSFPSPTNGILYTGPVTIDHTSTLRASGYLPGYLSSLPDAQTYIFLDQVLQQPSDPAGFPMIWQADYPADYGMDPNVVNHPVYGPELKSDLRAIPTLSIATEHASLWDPANGIYVDAVRSGELWERSASVELFNGDNSSEFQINAGIRMQGNASRDNVRTAKHSLRLLFQAEHGPSKLRHNWFGGGVDEFDNIVLRACFTDAWTTRYSPGDGGARYRPEDSIYLRDVWVKDSLAEMGHLSGRGTFVHLYLNGLYWGLYNATERLDASYYAQHLGGNENDWDVMRDFSEVLAGSKDEWTRMMNLVNAGITNESAYQAVNDLVDVENLADYMLLHLFAEAEDWPHHNWYAARRRATNSLPATKWVFLAWDQEIVLDQQVRRNRIGVNNDDTPARIYSQLRTWHEFRRLFGDRIQKHFFNGGALAPSNNISRLAARASQIHQAIVGESARWGDAREFPIGPNAGTGQTFTRDEWWVPELQKLYTNFLPTLNETSLARFRTAGLYPNLGAPTLSQFGGAVTPQSRVVLSHTNASGSILYTSDGTDPRSYGSGLVSAGAAAFETPLQFNRPTVIKARVLSSGQWSALVETTFYPPQDLSSLTLTEIMYNPPDVANTAGDEYEFLELKNTGTNVLDLSGLTFSGITFVFTNRTELQPGEIIVLVRNVAAFTSKYPGVTIDGVYSGRLDNAGENLRLSHPLGESIFSVNFDDRTPWPVAADLSDFSLVPVDPSSGQAPDNGARWRASALPGGSPGVDDPIPSIPRVVINEILSHTDPPNYDSIELLNPTASPVNIGGWFLTDDPSFPAKYRIPNDTILQPGGYAFFDERQFNAFPGQSNYFALSSVGDELYLFSADTNGQLTGYSHGVAFGASFNGLSFGRFVNSAGQESWPLQLQTSFGSPNSGPRIGPLVINEIHYHPATNGDEFLEILNLSPNPVPLFDPNRPTNTWKISGIDFQFPTNAVVPPQGLFLVVATNPAAFRAKYQVHESVLIFGPYPGLLQDSGEKLELQSPDIPNTNQVPYVTVEEVRYNDRAPWPASADGSGLSLQKSSPAGYGNEPSFWQAAAPTPGLRFGAGDSDGDGLPDSWEQQYGTLVNVADADLDGDGDGLSNLQEFLVGTEPNNGQSTLRLIISPGRDLEFSAVSNRTYGLVYKSTIEETNWRVLTNFPSAPNSRIIQWRDTTPPLPMRFYRVVTPTLTP